MREKTDKIFGVRNYYSICEPVTKKELKQIAEDRNITRLQYSNSLKTKSRKLINEIIIKKRPDIAIRIFGFYGKNKICDLNQVVDYVDVKRLWIDCMHDAIKLDAISNLKNITELQIGIFNNDSFDILARVPDSITKLSLWATRSKKPSLKYLTRFRNLQELSLEGHSKHIEVINELTHLKSLMLRSISTSDLSYISKLNNLEYLDVKLGGIKNFDILRELPKIKYLELWQVRGINDLSFISDMESMQYLFLQSLPNVRSLPDLSKLRKLRRIYIDNLKGLHDFRNVLTASRLNEFAFFSATKQSVEELLPVLKIKGLKKCSVYFGSQKKNDEFKRLLDERNIEECNYDKTSFKFNQSEDVL